MSHFVRTARIGATLFGACVLVAVATVPASAASDPKEKKQEAVQKSASGQVRVCTEKFMVTGSMLPRPRVCKTRDQWIKDTGIDPLATR